MPGSFLSFKQKSSCQHTHTHTHNTVMFILLYYLMQLQLTWLLGRQRGQLPLTLMYLRLQAVWRELRSIPRDGTNGGEIPAAGRPDSWKIQDCLEQQKSKQSSLTLFLFLFHKLLLPLGTEDLEDLITRDLFSLGEDINAPRLNNLPAAL